LTKTATLKVSLNTNIILEN